MDTQPLKHIATMRNKSGKSYRFYLGNDEKGTPIYNLIPDLEERNPVYSGYLSLEHILKIKGF